MLVPSTTIAHFTINSQRSQKALQNMARSHDRGDDHAFDNAVAVLRELLDISLGFEHVGSSVETYFVGLASGRVHLAEAPAEVPAVEVDVESVTVNRPLDAQLLPAEPGVWVAYLKDGGSLEACSRVSVAAHGESLHAYTTSRGGTLLEAWVWVTRLSEQPDDPHNDTYRTASHDEIVRRAQCDTRRAKADEFTCTITVDTDEALDSLSVVEARVTALDEKVDALIGKLKLLGSLNP